MKPLLEDNNSLNYPLPGDVHFLNGKKLLSQGKHAEAEQELKQALRTGTSYTAQAEYLLKSAVVARQPRQVVDLIESQRHFQ